MIRLHTRIDFYGKRFEFPIHKTNEWLLSARRKLFAAIVFPTRAILFQNLIINRLLCENRVDTHQITWL